MAIALTHVAMPGEMANYDSKSGTITIERTYLATESHPATVVLLANGALPAGIPHTITINDNLHAPPAPATVTLCAVDRRVERFKTAETEAASQTKIRVTYEGHVGGIVDVRYDSGTQSAGIKVDVNGIGIGANNEGVSREVPMRMVYVSENYGGGEFGRDYLDSCDAIKEKVNEALWPAYPLSLAGGPWKEEGEYLYLDYTSRVNRDGSLTIEHKFRADYHHGGLGKMHEHKWYFTNKTTVNVAGKERSQLGIVGPEQISQIYEVAAAPLTFGAVFTRWEYGCYYDNP